LGFNVFRIPHCLSKHSFFFSPSIFSFTIWSLNGGVASVTGHSLNTSDPRAAATDYEMKATWVNEEVVLASDNQGFFFRFNI